MIKQFYFQQFSYAWTAIDRLSIIWKSDLTDKMKRSFFQAAVVGKIQEGPPISIAMKVSNIIKEEEEEEEQAEEEEEEEAVYGKEV